MIATIQTKTTNEANVSLRQVWFEIEVDGKFLTSRKDIIEALQVRDEINAGADSKRFA